MKITSIYEEKIGCKTEKEVFAYLIANLNDSIRYWDYFVNWEKVFNNTRDFEIDLNILNYLIGKKNVEKEFAYLLKKQPQVARLVPALLACRERNFKILTEFKRGSLRYKNFTFVKQEKLTNTEISNVIKFARETGLLNLFKNKTIKNIIDYMIGVEVGLDSNGRKNRGGTAMENIVEGFVSRICKKHGFSYIKEANAEKVLRKWKLKLRVDKSSRRFDFAIYNGKNLYLIETNYYGGGGSKLKSTAGEYKALYDFLSEGGHKFIWVTDGLGWRTTSRPLEETFNYIEYLLNLKMLSIGFLEDIIGNNL